MRDAACQHENQIPTRIHAQAKNKQGVHQLFENYSVLDTPEPVDPPFLPILTAPEVKVEPLLPFSPQDVEPGEVWIPPSNVIFKKEDNGTPTTAQTQVPVKRKRGRPPGSSNKPRKLLEISKIEVIDASSGAVKRGRGRPKKLKMEVLDLRCVSVPAQTLSEFSPLPSTAKDVNPARPRRSLQAQANYNEMIKMEEEEQKDCKVFGIEQAEPILGRRAPGMGNPTWVSPHDDSLLSQKRGRGRPRKITMGVQPTIDAPLAAPKRGRGRPKKLKMEVSDPQFASVQTLIDVSPPPSIAQHVENTAPPRPRRSLRANYNGMRGKKKESKAEEHDSKVFGIKESKPMKPNSGSPHVALLSQKRGRGRPRKITMDVHQTKSFGSSLGNSEKDNEVMRNGNSHFRDEYYQNPQGMEAYLDEVQLLQVKRRRGRPKKITVSVGNPHSFIPGKTQNGLSGHPVCAIQSSGGEEETRKKRGRPRKLVDEEWELPKRGPGRPT